MLDASKYKPGYFCVDKKYNKWVERDHIEKPPIWCSVDMRDGNQALVIPMSLDQKLEYFKTLLDVGFKEIEVGFPAASNTEYEFLRKLIEENMIPSDVTVQVLTQAREHIIRKTFEACQGAPSAIIHFYNSTSVAQREQVFKKDKDQVKKIATDGALLVKKLSEEYDGNFRFEYSPESFTGTEPEYALEVCNEVLEILEPAPDNKVIINLPVTVEMSSPHVYASQVEFMHENLKYRDDVIISLHPHNDRGTGVADAELALLAGADRVEGTLFGNGERTGNVDIITLAMNMYSHGVDPLLDLSDMNHLVEKYVRCTKMNVYERTPYAGSLVFAAFSGSHQDAIAKGMQYREDNNLHEWTCPYLPIDPTDIGRTYDADVIRVNSQSGKGGVGYLLCQSHGYKLPPKMREALSYKCKDISDTMQKELKPDEIYEIFKENYLNLDSEIKIETFDLSTEEDGTIAEVNAIFKGEKVSTSANGNGAINAINNAIRAITKADYTLEVYSQHSMEGDGSRSVGASYIGIADGDGNMHWGAGTDTDVMRANINALLSAYTNMQKERR